METVIDLDFDQLWDYNKPAETEQRFRAIQPQIAQDSPAYVELLTQIARAQGLRRHFDDAHATLDQAEQALQKDWVRADVRYLLERGRVFNSSGQPDVANLYFFAAWEKAQAHGEDFYAIDAAHMLAIVEQPAAQLAWSQKALRLTERTQDPRAKKWLISLCNNIGWSYHDQADYPTALDYFRKALHHAEAQANPQRTRIAQWTVARCLRSLGALDEALSMQLALLSEYEQIGEKDGYLFEELGELLLQKGQAQQAAPYFALAYAELSQDAWLVEHEGPRLERLQELAKI